MVKKAQERKHKFFAIAGKFGFTFNNFDTNQLMPDDAVRTQFGCQPSGNTANTIICSCADDSCQGNYNGCLWSISQISRFKVNKI
jgi:hypothetical protein